MSNPNFWRLAQTLIQVSSAVLMMTAFALTLMIIAGNSAFKGQTSPEIWPSIQIKLFSIESLLYTGSILVHDHLKL